MVRPKTMLVAYDVINNSIQTGLRTYGLLSGAATDAFAVLNLAEVAGWTAHNIGVLGQSSKLAWGGGGLALGVRATAMGLDYGPRLLDVGSGLPPMAAGPFNRGAGATVHSPPRYRPMILP